MSSLLNPVGPEPASVYWRRRIVVIVGALVVLLLLWWLISPGGSGAPTAASASPTTLPTVATMSPSASPSVSVSGSPSASTTSGAPCQDTDITVSVSSQQTVFPLGSPVSFIMKITNNGVVACSRDVGAAANTFVITSGGFDVWSSDACSPSSETQVEEIPPGEAYAVKGTWDGSVTANGCGASATAAEAGAYQVVAKNGDITSDPLSFTLG